MTEYSIYDIIDRIRSRTGMYVGEVTLSSINVFLTGYCVAMKDSGIPDTTSPAFFPDFNIWVKNKLGFDSSCIGWCSMILAFSVNPEAPILRDSIDEICRMAKKPEHDKSVDLFFSLVDEYKQKNISNNLL
ncbi:hypothetical protein [Microbulbifer sediminum]|uniref:hypothetical protein n=1 Tax=Microbulbifer sediminum TaxID=2904250 RepID=UPI001F1A1EFE|nr:hypothetical protein [Microbulbifer sediminum]